MTGDQVEVRLLGQVRVVRRGRALDPGGPVRATILAVLAAAAPDAVPRQRLVDAAWPDDPPASARNSLQAHISKLRRLLEPGRAAGDRSVLASVGDGYRLDIDPLATDIGRFRGRVATAATAADWRAALRAGAGAPLAGCVDSWPVEVERRSLEQERLRAVDAWVEAELREGRPGEEVIGDLEGLVAEHPLRERSWALLVTALGAAGRRAEALDAFQRARRVLVETAGVEPGRELQDAQREVLRADPRADDEVDVGPVRRIPAPRTPLIGRDAEIERLVDLLGRWRLVTIVGPGGVGKTRLAREVARRPVDPVDEAVFVDLTGVRGDHEVLPTVAGACGVRFVGGPRGLEDTLVERLRRTPTLLVLDNAEHVLVPVARLVDLLLDEVETVVVLATSRRALEVGGERLFRLEPMDPEDAVALFLERVEARRPAGARSPDRSTVRQLCDHLDRLPLAIELAAGHTDHLSVEEILAAAARRPQSLRRAGRATVPEPGGRHASLRSTVAWSYELLAPETQAVLRHLAVFRAAFDRDRAGSVIPVVPGDRGGRDVADPLGELVSHSLLIAEPGPTGTTYRLLETIRDFARAELERHGEVERAEGRHRAWYVEWARGQPSGTTALDTASALSLDGHRADLVAALEHAHRTGDVVALADLAVLASGLAFCPGGLPDAGRWTGIALEGADGVDGGRRADLLAVGMLDAMLGDDRDMARERFHAALPLLQAHPGGVGPFVLALGMSDSRMADTAGREAERLLRRHGDDVRPAVAHAIATMRPVVTARRDPDHERSLAEAEAAWEGRPWSDRQTIATWTVHAALLHVTGRHAALQDRLDGMEPIPAELGPPTFFRSIFEALALAGRGERDAALDRLREAHARHWRGIPGIESDLLSSVATVDVLTGEPDRARWLLDRRGFRARHPGTAIVHVDSAARLDVAVGGYLSDWARGADPGLAELLDEVLAT